MNVEPHMVTTLRPKLKPQNDLRRIETISDKRNAVQRAAAGPGIHRKVAIATKQSSMFPPNQAVWNVSVVTHRWTENSRWIKLESAVGLNLRTIG